MCSRQCRSGFDTGLLTFLLHLSRPADQRCKQSYTFNAYYVNTSIKGYTSQTWYIIVIVLISWKQHSKYSLGLFRSTYYEGGMKALDAGHRGPPFGAQAGCHCTRCWIIIIWAIESLSSSPSKSFHLTDCTIYHVHIFLSSRNVYFRVAYSLEGELGYIMYTFFSRNGMCMECVFLVYHILLEGLVYHAHIFLS